MSQLLSLSKAARLIGISRSSLQEKIRVHQLPTFEGKIALSDLLDIYPEIAQVDSPILERVKKIRAEASFGKSAQEKEYGVVSTPEAMEERILSLSRELVATKNQLQRANDFIAVIAYKLTELNDSLDTDLRRKVNNFLAWFHSQ